MGKKERIIFLTLIVMIFVATIIVFSIKTLKEEENATTNDSSTTSNINTNDSTRNTSQNSVSYKDVNKNEINLNEVDYENSDYIFYHEEQAGYVPYSREQLDNFSFNIANVPENVLNAIADRNEFYIQIKEFVYKNGLVSATTAEYAKYDFNQEENILIIYFRLNDNLLTKLEVKINLNDNSMKVSKMK